MNAKVSANERFERWLRRKITLSLLVSPLCKRPGQLIEAAYIVEHRSDFTAMRYQKAFWVMRKFAHVRIHDLMQQHFSVTGAELADRLDMMRLYYDWCEEELVKRSTSIGRS